MRRGLQTLHRLRRRIGEDKAEERKTVYEKLLVATEATIRQVEQIRDVLRQVRGEGKDRAKHLTAQIDQYLPLVQQVMSQAQRRVLAGKKVPAREKIVSLFEPHTCIIPRHKGGADVEVGRMVVVDEVEGGIITRFAVLEDKTAEQGQLAPALEHHRQLFGRAPWMATGDRGVHAPENERVARDAGVTLRTSERGRACPREGSLLSQAVSLASGDRGAAEQLTAGLRPQTLSRSWGGWLQSPPRLGRHRQQPPPHSTTPGSDGDSMSRRRTRSTPIHLDDYIPVVSQQQLVLKVDC